MPVFLRFKLNTIFQNDKMIKKFKETFNIESIENINVCLYGEGYGARINTGGKYISDDVNFVLFDIKIGNWWLKRNDVNKLGKELKLDTVPNILTGNLEEAIGFVKNGFKSQWGDFQSEGLVGVPEIELKTRRGDRIIVKIKYNDLIRNYIN